MHFETAPNYKLWIAASILWVITLIHIDQVKFWCWETNYTLNTLHLFLLFYVDDIFALNYRSINIMPKQSNENVVKEWIAPVLPLYYEAIIWAACPPQGELEIQFVKSSLAVLELDNCNIHYQWSYFIFICKIRKLPPWDKSLEAHPALVQLCL